MRNDEQEKQILQKLIKRFGTRWEAQAQKAMERLYEQIEAGASITKAVATLREEYGELFKLDGLQDMITEAACYGYGIMPSVLTSTQHAAWGAALATSWDASGMTLSEKIHGVGVKMRGEIIRTLQTQMQRNQTWLSAARALYDGYSQGKNAFTGRKDIIQEQEIPKYLQKVLIATNDSQTAVAQRQALQNINRLARNGAPNKALQAAYNELLETVKEENDKAMYKAVRTAIHEKSRYVAERITRTEMARAYADGFIAKISKDEDIVAVKFKLSGRHPTFDLCDMYAKADMFGLGKGIYPKDKLPPLPIHPHCLCHYSEIIEGEVDMKKSADHVRAAGDTWLNGLSESQRRQVLGVKGVKAWQSGEDWRKYMRGYAGLKDVGSRLANVAPKVGSLNSPVVISVADCKKSICQHSFSDGTAIGVKKTVEATVYETPDGVKFIFPKRYSKAHQTMTPEQAIRCWNKVPDKIKKQAQKEIEFVDYYNPQDSYWKKLYKNFPHSYATGGDKIVFYRYDYPHNDEYVIRTYCHEIGHHIDKKKMKNGVCLSDSAAWRSAMKADEKVSGKKSPTKYGENAAREDFAESIAECVKDPVKFAAEFPDRYGILLNSVLK